ncbi:hypothetical protein HYW75_01055 [Candidatus Pacearchaeota archaeon]|nr:hypothetical protein [Candidatus Pacearchaeota archaeon]
MTQVTRRQEEIFYQDEYVPQTLSKPATITNAFFGRESANSTKKNPLKLGLHILLSYSQWEDKRESNSATLSYTNIKDIEGIMNAADVDRPEKLSQRSLNRLVYLHFASQTGFSEVVPVGISFVDLISRIKIDNEVTKNLSFFSNFYIIPIINASSYPLKIAHTHKYRF